MQLLKGKFALVTGGTAGIGKEIALAFARQGASVAIFGTNADRANQVLSEMTNAQIDLSQQFSSHLVDVSKYDEVEKAIEAVLHSWGRVDILVNNAGITRDQLLMRMTEEDWDLVLNVNLKSAFNTCRSLARSMMKARSGVMINISSVVGLTGNAGQVNYAASKSGMIGLTKSLAKELAGRGIRVNCIAPGYIDTPMTETLSDQVKQKILEAIPLKRMGHPSDIANAAIFLASDLSSYMTGQTIAVDGGMVM